MTRHQPSRLRRACLITAVALGGNILMNCAAFAEYKVGQRVAIVESASLRLGTKTTAQAMAGEIVQVKAINGKWLWVVRSKDGVESKGYLDQKLVWEVPEASPSTTNDSSQSVSIKSEVATASVTEERRPAPVRVQRPNIAAQREAYEKWRKQQTVRWILGTAVNAWRQHEYQKSYSRQWPSYPHGHSYPQHHHD